MPATTTSHREGVSKSGGDLTALKSDKLYYRIGEVSRITGIKPYVLRYWESEFRWMSPAKSRSKQRLYRKKDIETILLIKKLLYEERFTIAGAKKRLKEIGCAVEAGQMKMPIEDDPKTRVKHIREELEGIRSLLKNGK
jgi:DNA-binding transcriptional MerR regulator